MKGLRLAPFRSRTLGRVAAVAVAALAVGVVALSTATVTSLEPLPASLDRVASASEPRRQVLDRSGLPLTLTFTTDWNVHDRVALHDVPGFLREAFITAEDRRFYVHGGVDWRARAAALITNLTEGRAVRGASTITEQVVRMLHPRPRTLWSKWLEGFEARRDRKSVV